MDATEINCNCDVFIVFFWRADYWKKSGFQFDENVMNLYRK